MGRERKGGRKGVGRGKKGTLARKPIGSISAAFSSPVYVPPREESSRVRGRSAGSFPEQRLVIEPSKPTDFEKTVRP